MAAKNSLLGRKETLLVQIRARIQTIEERNTMAFETQQLTIKKKETELVNKREDESKLKAEKANQIKDKKVLLDQGRRELERMSHDLEMVEDQIEEITTQLEGKN